MNFVDRAAGVDPDDFLWLPRRLGQESSSKALAEVIPMPFHSIELALNSLLRRSRGHVEKKGQIGVSALRDECADLPDAIDIQPAGIPLIDHVGQQESVGNDGLSRR